MSNVHDLPCQPDSTTLTEFMGRLFANSGQRGFIEIAWTSPHRPHGLNHAAQFDLANLDDAIAHAERINSMTNCNVYFGAGLRRPGIQGRASDRDVESIVAYWSDFDAQGALGAAIETTKRLRIEPNLITYTGLAPHMRGQMWWLLDEPTKDLGHHRMIQSVLATALGGDHTVTNHSRVMRLIGSVAWPLKTGRVLEMTGIEATPRLEPYTSEEMTQKLEAAGLLAPQSASVLGLDGLKYKKTWSDYVEETFTPSQWHQAMVPMVGILVSRGLSRDEIKSLAPMWRRPGYSIEQTVAEVMAAADGAFRKWNYDPAGKQQPAPATPESLEFVPLSGLQSRDPPAWQIAGIIPEKSFGYVYGPSATFKTFVSVDMALSIAYGRAWQGRPVKPGKVLYILGEGQGAFANRVRSWRHARGLIGTDASFWTLFQPIQFMNPKDVGRLVQAIKDTGVDPDWIFLDTVQRNFGVGDPDKTQDMTMFVAAIDAVRAELDCGIFAVHHAGKDVSKGARNSSVLFASADWEMKTEREQTSPSFTLISTKTKDWEEFGRLHLKTEAVPVIDPRTGEEVVSLVVSDVPEEGAAPVAPVKPAGSMQNLIVSVLKDGGSLTFGEIVARTGGNKGTIWNSLKALQEKNALTKDLETGCYFIPEGNQHDEW